MALVDVIRRYRERADCNTVTPPVLQPVLQVTPEKTTTCGDCNPCNTVTPKNEDGGVQMHESDPSEVVARPAGARSEPAQGLPHADPESAPQADAARSARDLHHQYMTHHLRCPRCTSAGLTGKPRCPTGAALWRQYCDAFRREGLPSYPRSPASERPAEPPKPARWSHAPASEQEVDRMAERWERARAAGLSDGEADRLADALLLRDRHGPRDLRSCLECAAIRAAGDGWWCAAQRLPLARVFVVELHRCVFFEGGNP